jgi:uncharacterized Zn finger protein
LDPTVVQCPKCSTEEIAVISVDKVGPKFKCKSCNHVFNLAAPTDEQEQEVQVPRVQGNMDYGCGWIIVLILLWLIGTKVL